MAKPIIPSPDCSGILRAVDDSLFQENAAGAEIERKAGPPSRQGQTLWLPNQKALLTALPGHRWILRFAENHPFLAEKA